MAVLSYLDFFSTGVQVPFMLIMLGVSKKGVYFQALLKLGQDEGRGGPHTRNAARRKGSLDTDVQMKSVDGESTSEDEDFDISPADIDDVLVIEDDGIFEDDDEDHDDVLRDDSLPVCMPNTVHDVKLGEERPAGGATNDNQANPACGSSSSRCTAVRGSDSIGSRGVMSFAAAAMAGLSSANGGRGGSRGGRDRHEQPLFGSPRLIFSSGGKQLNRLIYQAVQRQLVLDEDDDNGGDFISSDDSRLWDDIYTVTYQRADSQTVGTVTPSKSTTTAKAASNLNSNSGDPPIHPMSLLDSILQGELPCDLEKNNPTYNILSLLRLLEGLNQLAPCLRVQSATDSFAQGKISRLDDLNVTSGGVRIPSDEFINSKLTPKLSRQIQDALALCSGSLPSWCYQLIKACSFLFPFEIRRQYFYSTAFGLSRALHGLQQQQGAEGHGSLNEREFRVGRLQRQKVRVSRKRILESAGKVMEMYSSQKAVLEVEYFGEVGTGLGPTLEFYTLLSHDLQRVGLRMWRCNSPEPVGDEPGEKKVGKGAEGDLVLAPLGLFPRPWPLTIDASDGTQFFKITEHFCLLGRVMAKALQDGRLLDLPLSAAFHKLVLGQELDLHDITLFDGEFGKTLQELQAKYPGNNI